MFAFATLIIVLVCAYGLLYILDALMRAFEFSPYIDAVSKAGIDVGLFQIRWYTKSFNRIFLKTGRFNPNLVRPWFLVGAWVINFQLILYPHVLLGTAIDVTVPVPGTKKLHNFSQFWNGTEKKLHFAEALELQC